MSTELYEGIIRIILELRFHPWFYAGMTALICALFQPEELRDHRLKTVIIHLATWSGVLPWLWMMSLQFVLDNTTARRSSHFLGFVLLAVTAWPALIWWARRLTNRDQVSSSAVLNTGGGPVENNGIKLKF